MGSDLFVYQAMEDAGDFIYGIDMRAGDNDGLDLRPLFDALGYTGTDPRADGYLRVEDSGGNAQVQIDANGPSSGANYITMVTLAGVNATDFTDNYFLFQ